METGILVQWPGPFLALNHQFQNKTSFGCIYCISPDTLSVFTERPCFSFWGFLQGMACLLFVLGVGQSDSNLVNVQRLPTRSHELCFHLSYPSHLIKVREQKYKLNLAVFLGDSFFSATVTHSSWALFIQSINIYWAPTIFQELFLVLAHEQNKVLSS